MSRPEPTTAGGSRDGALDGAFEDSPGSALDSALDAELEGVVLGGTRPARPRRARELPTYARPRFLALVFVGGAFGTAAREGLSLAFGPVGGVPWTTFAINVLGAFCLGLLLDGLARLRRDEGLRRAARLGIGTGFLGGFTTYSSLAVDGAGLLGEGRVGVGLLYAAATLVLGGLAAWAGIAAAGYAHTQRTGATR